MTRYFHLYLASFVPAIVIGSILGSCNPTLFAIATEPESNTVPAIGSKVVGFSLTDYQGKEWCRVSIGTQDEMKNFVKAFDEVIA